MKLRRVSIGLPLLVKELIELAARRRTYVVRVVYACLLFVAAFLMFYDTLSAGRDDPFAVLGHGQQMFGTIVTLQFLGIYLFMPAMTCGVLTFEKERNSLGLLFLTRLGPWAILFEKYLGRLVPMLMYLLLSLPLMAFTYSLGGIAPDYLWAGVWLLFVSLLQVGALAIMCSSWFRTTVSAFIATYVLGLVLFFLMPICKGLGLIDFDSDFANMFFGPYVFFAPSVSSIRAAPATDVFPRSFPIILSTVAFLIMARVFLVRRAFAQPRHLLLGLFRNLDRLFSEANENRWTRGIVLAKDGASLPEDNPVSWRETTKKSLGTVRYLFRILVVIELPVAVVCVLIVGSDTSSELDGLSLLLFLLWFIAILLLSVTSASLISSERSHQTLDVLIATPLTSREIVQQKASGVRRMLGVLLIPFITIFLFKLWWFTYSGASYGYSYGRQEFSGPLYLICSLLSVGIYLPMISWLSLLIGLRARTQTRAIIGSLAAFVGWSVVPYFLFAVMADTMLEIRPGDGLVFLALSSPAAIVLFNEFVSLDDIGLSPKAAVVVNFVIYGAALLMLRAKCLNNADWYLRRRRKS